MKFPKRLRHRGRDKVQAVIHKLPIGCRCHWRQQVDEKPRSQVWLFQSYDGFKRDGDKLVADLA